MWKQVLRSRKFWAALVGLVYSILAVYLPQFPLNEEAVANGTAVLAAYILGVALEDGVRGKSQQQ